MNEIKCMVVDDEPIARDILKNHIAATPGLVLVKSCMNATDAYEGLHAHEIDLIFLDIQMPIITGTEFLRSLRNPPLVIFTTAYHDYAVEGFELNSVDYLLKPIVYERFYQAIQKVQERLAAKPAHKVLAPVDYIFIKQDNRLVRIFFDQIRYVEAEKDFSTVFLNDKKLLAGMHLKMFEAILPDTHFLRIHRSYIVSLSKITSINGNTAELGQIKIPIGASYKNELLKRLGISGTG
jgi:DNA-binding LytR/AlgR family response regulator